MLSKIYLALSSELIQQRLLLDLSQEELGNLVGKTERSIRTYEQNHYRGATVETVIKIAKVLEKRQKQRIKELKRS